MNDAYRCEVELANMQDRDSDTFHERLAEARNEIRQQLREFEAPVELDGSRLIVDLPKLLSGSQRIEASSRVEVVLDAKGLAFVSGKNQFFA